MYDHPVSRDYNKSVSCDGCNYCPDVDYLSEDSDDSYFLNEPYFCRRGYKAAENERSIDEFDYSYNFSLLFEPDIYRDDNLSGSGLSDSVSLMSLADDW